jgi:Tfp pilus assembly PilM family ATPase
MLKRWLNRAEPIGCHIGGGRVRLAQVQASSSDGPRIVAAERPLPDAGASDNHGTYDPAAVGALLRDMIRSAPFRGSRVVTCPPPGAARYATMRLAPMPATDLAHAAHWKLASDLGIGTADFKSAVLNVVEVRDAGKQKTEAMVVSAPLADLDRHVEAVAAAGLEHVAIDDPACAISRCIGIPIGATGVGAAADPRVALDLRDEEAFLAIATGADLSFVRPVGPGLAQLNKMLADLLEITPAEALELQARVLAVVRIGGGGDDVSRPAKWPFAVSFQRAREAIADASRMYGRELARQVALAMYYYSTAATAAAPGTGVVVSDRTIDPAVLEAVTVQSGIDLAAFNPAGPGAWTSLLAGEPGRDPATWATAVGLSLYESAPPTAKEAA